MRFPLPAVLVAALAASLAGSSACSDPPAPTTCNDLAPPACPTDYDADVCGDHQCASVYACDNGTWSFVQNCPNYSADAAAHPAEAGPDGFSFGDAPFDAPPGAFGGPGCVDLEPPDCALGTALACTGTADCCGCTDLYVCVSGGWNLWGECADGGIAASGP
jgi:hypothetical protein